MAYSFTQKKRIRKNFGRLRETMEFPNLLSIQLESYKQYLQQDVKSDERENNVGLQAAFRAVLPIESANRWTAFDFVKYELRDAPFTWEECLHDGKSYTAPLHVTLRLIHYDRESKTREIKEAIEQEVFVGFIPLMTPNGTFVINGTERVVVSQLHRSPGVYMMHDDGKTYANRKVFSARVIPAIGSWLDFELGFDSKEHKERKQKEREDKESTDRKIRDQNRKDVNSQFLAEVRQWLLKEGVATDDLVERYVGTDDIVLSDTLGFIWYLTDPERYIGMESPVDLVDDNDRIIVAEGSIILPRHAQRLSKASIEKQRIPITADFLKQRQVAEDIVDPANGEVILEQGRTLDEGSLSLIQSRDIQGFKTVHINSSKYAKIVARLVATISGEVEEHEASSVPQRQYEYLQGINALLSKGKTENTFADVLAACFETDEYTVLEDGEISLDLPDSGHLLGRVCPVDVKGERNRNIVRAGTQITQYHVSRLKKVESIEVPERFLLDQMVANPIVNPTDGSELLAVGEMVTPTTLEQIRSHGIPNVSTLYFAADTAEDLTVYLKEAGIHPRTLTKFVSEHPELPMLSDEEPAQAQRRISGRKEEELQEVYIDTIEKALDHEDRSEELARIYNIYVKHARLADSATLPTKGRGERERDQQEYVFVRIDRKKKLHVTHMLRALDLSDQEILDEFYETFTFEFDGDTGQIRYSQWDPNHLRGETARIDYKNKKGQVICEAGSRINRRNVRNLNEMDPEDRCFDVPDGFFDGLILAKDIEDAESGELIMSCNTILNAERINLLRNSGVSKFETLAISGFKDRSFIADTLRRDPDTEPNNDKQRSLVEIYSVMRPGEPVTLDSATDLFEKTFFKHDRYELSSVGRMKFNRRLGWEEETTLPKLTVATNVKLNNRIVARKGEQLNPEIVNLLRKAVTSGQNLQTTKDENLKAIDVFVDPEELDPDEYIRQLTTKYTYKDEEGTRIANAGDTIYGATLKRLRSMDVAKLEASLKLDSDLDVLDKYDVLGVLKKLLEVVQVPDEEAEGEQETVDDIDSLGNRRVRSVGELAEIAFRGGLRRVDRAVKDRLSNAWADKLMPQDLINTKPIAAAVNEFFGGHEMSQFMEQTNPLAEVTHKRKVSALGPGGLTRDHAGYEVRDVHRSHYGRVCPIETPEGANIGLISSLTIHAKTNEHGFIECPFRTVEDGEVTDKIEYLSFMDEGQHPIAQANAPLTNKSTFAEQRVDVRVDGEFMRSAPHDVKYMDVSPKQIVSISAALIPFLEHDEANRGLMGSNQQRQAVPTVKVEAPLVATGVESHVARDSGVCITAKEAGVVELVDASRIAVRSKEDGFDGMPNVEIYSLTKYRRSNQDTCINHRPIVQPGDEVEAGDVLADGPSVDLGELALGQNMRIAFMMWNGFNYEDSILVSERVVEEDRFTSIHILEETCYARETKIGHEEITADIPNVGDSALSQLDESGIVRIGAQVKEQDILVGKVTPREESQATGEEKLLRAIFGAKADDVKDTSLRVPAGVHGTVIDVRVFNREGVDKDERALTIEEESLVDYEKDLNDQYQIVRRSKFRGIREAIVDKQAVSVPGYDGGRVITDATLDGMDSEDDWLTIRMEDDNLNRMLDSVDSNLKDLAKRHATLMEEKQEKISQSKDLQASVLKEVRVYLATKKRIQAGDKMAGRHGNKGVISVIMPAEDMPYDENGEPIDIILNPLGVPSRMNVGQVLETQLGWAAKGIGKQIGEMIDQQRSATELRKYLKQIYNKTAGQREDLDSLTSDELKELAGNLRDGMRVTTPIFDGAKEEDICELLEMAGLPTSGQTTLYDGRTGEPFDRPVTMGYMYMLKLHHLVDDKMHARATGAYSMVTQQPLGGKARQGGQRFGEMEVWALEAYGAAHTLQEMLTFKSDDLDGRAEVYRRIVDGQYQMQPGIPESFNVIRREIRSLGLNVELENV